MAEHHRLSRTPVLVIDMRTVLRRKRASCVASFLISWGRPIFSCPLSFSPSVVVAASAGEWFSSSRRSREISHGDGGGLLRAHTLRPAFVLFLATVIGVTQMRIHDLLLLTGQFDPQLLYEHHHGGRNGQREEARRASPSVFLPPGPRTKPRTREGAAPDHRPEE